MLNSFALLNKNTKTDVTKIRNSYVTYSNVPHPVNIHVNNERQRKVADKIATEAIIL